VPDRAWTLAVLLAAAGCAEMYYLDLPDIDLEVPDDIARRQEEFLSGEGRFHGDPRAVADLAIRRHLDVPWKADPFKPSQYSVQESKEWGTYVTRGYRYPSGHVMRYRVKVRRLQDVWYPVQISRYKIQELDPLDGQGGHGGHAH
jgi:hypothetical protein